MSKIRIPVEKLPPPDIYGNHTLQFRVVSEDRNRLSAWSPLYAIKSIGQYRPLQSDVVHTYSVDNNEVFSVTWDTPTIYNYDVSLVSASIAHNHSQNFKQHQTDIFIRWYNMSENGHFEYHDRVLNDTTSIVKSTDDVLGGNNGPSHVEILGLVSTYGLSGLTGEELDIKISQIRDYFTIFSLTIDL